MVKDKRGRRRYIAFSLTQGGPVTKSGLISMLREASRERGIGEPRVMQFDGGRGIVRCAHTFKDETIEILKVLGEGRGDFQIMTLSTSGTLKKLREKYFKNDH